MSTPQIERIALHLRQLKLNRLYERLEGLLEEAGSKEPSYVDFLDTLLTEEVADKREKALSLHTRMASFPFIKTLEQFDFGYQPSIDHKLVKELATCRFVDNYTNVVILGPPGTGKTHLSIALGLRAIAAQHRVLFTSATALCAALAKAQAENRLEVKLKQYCFPKLLIVDEIGYIPFDRLGANLFFQLVSRRYERGSILLTSNKSFGAWGEVFGDPVLASAILDRILHHSVVINVRGKSYRLKEKLRAGLLSVQEAQT